MMLILFRFLLSSLLVVNVGSALVQPNITKHNRDKLVNAIIDFFINTPKIFVSLSYPYFKKIFIFQFCLKSL